VILYAQSTGDGCFSTYYIPDQAGFWLVEASWNGNADYGGATSVQEGFNVKKLQSQISLLWSPPIPVRGDILRLRGVLIPKGLEATVNVLVSDDDGKSWTVAASSKTTPNGEYYAELRIEKAGILLLKTVWEGNEYYSACVSPVLRLAVNDEVLSRTVKFSDNSEAKILLSTDVSAATFDLDVSNGRIDIHLADPVQDGTEALVNIFIPEKMLEYYGRSISDLAFAVDGSPITPEFIGSMGGYFAAVQCGRNLTISIYFLTYSLTVNVKDSQGNDISGANVSLNGPVTLNGFTDDSGIVCFNQLPRGEYSIEVHYGPKIGEYRLGISGDASAVFSTPITLRYVDLVLIKEEETMKALMYLLLAVIVAFTVFTVSHESREARFK
jgi:hypothetical protein